MKGMKSMEKEIPDAPRWNGRTAFLEWERVCGADGNTFFRAEVGLLELDVTIRRDASGKTWGVWLDGQAYTDEIPSAAQAQLHAVAAVMETLAERCGDPMADSTDDPQRCVRALMQTIHRRLVTGVSADARECYGKHYTSPKRGETPCC